MKVNRLRTWGVLAAIFVTCGCQSGDRVLPEEQLPELRELLERAQELKAAREHLEAQYRALPNDRFFRAEPGEFWIIKSKDVGLMFKPETTMTLEQFKRSLVTLLDPLSKVEIVESKGWLSVWKRVYLVRDRDNERLLHGWIAADTVKQAAKLN